MIEIRLLGAQSVRDEGGHELLSVSARPKRFALLTYLTLSGSTGDGFVSRDELLALFWPEADEEHARNTLNQYVYRLRGSLGSETILSRGLNRVGIDPERVWCDAVEFQSTARAGLVERALELYAGEFLPGFHVDAGVELERWLDAYRDRLRGVAASLALEQARALSEDGLWSEAASAYRLALEIEPGLDVAQQGLRLAVKRASGTPLDTVPFSGPAHDPVPSEPRPTGMRRPIQTVSESQTADRSRQTWARYAALAAGVVLLTMLATGRFDADRASKASVVPSGDDARPTIAVLPFVNLSGDMAQEYFSDGITEELISVLGSIPDLKVEARTSSWRFKDRIVDIRIIGDSLGVDYIVEGSVRKAGDRLRITAQLIETADGSHLWSEQFDRLQQDVFSIQTDIAASIAGQLKIPLGVGVASRLVWPTEDFEAYDLYLAGRDLLRNRADDLTRAAELFERVVDRDSTWAPAWAGLAESYALVPWFSQEADSALWARSLARAEGAANRALALDPYNASATLALANVLRDRWDFAAAESTYVRALTLNPDNAETHQEYADYLGSVGRQDEAYAAIHRALTLDPAAIRFNEAGVVAGDNGRFTEALDLFARGLAMNPPPILRERMQDNQTWVLRLSGEWTEYRRRLLADHGDAVPKLAAVWPADGSPTPEAADLLTRRGSILGAVFWLRLGELDRALDALEQRFRSRPPFGSSGELWELPFDPIREEPRFQALLKRRGLQGLPSRLE